MSTSSANPTTARNLTHPTEHHSPSQAFDAILSNQSTNTNPKPLQLQHVLEEHPHKTIMGAVGLHLAKLGTKLRRFCMIEQLSG